MNEKILVTYAPGAEEKEIYREILDGIANVYYLADATDIERTELLASADVIVSLSFSQKLSPFKYLYLPFSASR